MFDKLYDLFFSPLGEEYCDFFLFRSYILFTKIILFLIAIVILGANKIFPQELRYVTLAKVVIVLLLLQFTSRLMYSMCIN